MGPEATPSTEPSTPQDEEEEVPTPSDPTLLESPLLLSDDTLGELLTSNRPRFRTQNRGHKVLYRQR